MQGTCDGRAVEGQKLDRISNEYPDVKCTIRTTMSPIYRNDISRNGKPKRGGRGTILAAVAGRRACFTCNETGHIAHNCPDHKQQEGINMQEGLDSTPGAK